MSPGCSGRLGIVDSEGFEDVCAIAFLPRDEQPIGPGERQRGYAERLDGSQCVARTEGQAGVIKPFDRKAVGR